MRNNRMTQNVLKNVQFSCVNVCRYIYLYGFISQMLVENKTLFRFRCGGIFSTPYLQGPGSWVCVYILYRRQIKLIRIWYVCTLSSVQFSVSLSDSEAMENKKIYINQTAFDSHLSGNEISKSIRNTWIRFSFFPLFLYLSHVPFASFFMCNWTWIFCTSMDS